MQSLLRFVAIVVATTMLCSGGAQGQPKDKGVLMLNWYLYSEHAPFFLGKERGFYDQEGIDLDVQEGRGSGVTVQAVAANTATFGDVGNGFCRKEYPCPQGHRRQDRGDNSGRLDVADLALVPEEDGDQGNRFQDRRRRCPDQAQCGYERTGRSFARLRHGSGN